MRTRLLLIAFILLSVMGWAAVPQMPQDPSSDEAFVAIKAFYHLGSSLPEFKVAAIENKVEPTYHLQTVHLSLSDYPEVILTLKLPKVLAQPLPAVVLFTGFQTGDDAVKLVGDPGQVIYVGFQYPWPINFLEGNLHWDWRRMEVIPIMMAVAMSWLSQQPFINHEKINVVAVSFGTLFYPLAQRLLNENSLYAKTIVFGYGGVDIAEIIGNHFKKNMGKTELEFAKAYIRSQTWFLEPLFHIHHLRGPFLVVTGEEDTVFPVQSREGLVNGLSDPKKLVTLPGSHIQPDKPQLIQTFMNEVEKFLLENQGI